MPRRALLVTYSLEMGGTQRVSLFVAETLARADWEPILVVCADRPFQLGLPAGVRMVPLFDADQTGIQVGGRGVRHWHRLRRLIRRESPRVIVGFGNTPSVLAILAAAGTGVPVLASDHVAPSRDPYERGAWRMIVRVAYPFADRVVSVSAGVSAERSWLPREKRIVVPNAVWVDAAEPTRGIVLEPAASPHIVAVGRLHAQKGFDLLLEAFRRVAPQHPDWHLTIVGEGPERARLEGVSKNLQLGGRVHLPGASPAPPANVLRAAANSGGIFAFPSRYEGFGLTLVEAMACGLPVVAADCPHGPREILGGGEYGLLIPPENPSALAAALTSLMGSGEKRARLAALASTRVKEYEPDRIRLLWLRLIEDVISLYAPLVDPAG